MTAERTAARLHAERHGLGAPLLLIHGLGSSLRGWDLVMPQLAAERDVIAVDLPGFGGSAPLAGPVTIETLTDAVQAFLTDQQFGDVPVVGSSLGGRVALELAARGHPAPVLALAPLGFWSGQQAAIFRMTTGASLKALRAAHPLLPLLGNNPIGRGTLLAPFSARPWTLPEDFVLAELRRIKGAPGLDRVLDALRRAPEPAGPVTPGGPVTLGWGRQDKVALPSQAERVQARFPDAMVRWFDDCGHFPQWDQPEEAVRLILEATA